MTEELKQKAERFRKKYKQDIIDNDDFEMLDNFDVNVERAYIAGATENGIQWHDLRKDPNDLPKESCSVLVTYEYDDRTYTDDYINDKEHNIIGWESEYKDPYCSPRVIAWAEKPQFKE